MIRYYYSIQWLFLFTLLACGMTPTVTTTILRQPVVQEDASFLESSSTSSTSCAMLDSCMNCSNTYTCHWCAFDNQCHAKGSIHGCKWGASCHAKPSPKKKENSTCASHSTCSECSLSSHLCHWCDSDNACHAVGSPYGCTVGVDCYSNDRCRRKEPEPFHKFVWTEVPTSILLVILGISFALFLCLTWCHCCFFNVKGAYDDLATITMAASLPPTSVIHMGNGDEQQPLLLNHQTLETHEEGDEAAAAAAEEDEFQDASETAAEDEESPTSRQPPPEQQQPPTRGEQHEECNSNHYILMNDHRGQPPPQQTGETSTPFIPSSARSFHGIPGMEEPPHMAALYRSCSVCYYCLVICLLILTGGLVFFFPKPPVYNVCSDALEWTKIMENVVAGKLDAPIEILISVSNMNHLTVNLDKGGGTFLFDNKPVGTYQIPPDVAGKMAISDMMLIARVQPEDKYQAFQMAEAYYRGKLILEANFAADLRVPALWDVTYHFEMKNVQVKVNELADRSLCQCPSWDQAKNHTKPTPTFPFLLN